MSLTLYCVKGKGGGGGGGTYMNILWMGLDFDDISFKCELCGDLRHVLCSRQ